MVQTVDDGDFEIRVYDIAADEWTKVTDNLWSDYVAGDSHGVLLAESHRELDRTVWIYSLATGSKKTIITQTTDALHGDLSPEISRDRALTKTWLPHIRCVCTACRTDSPFRCCRRLISTTFLVTNTLRGPSLGTAERIAGGISTHSTSTRYTRLDSPSTLM